MATFVVSATPQIGDVIDGRLAGLPCQFRLLAMSNEGATVEVVAPGTEHDGKTVDVTRRAPGHLFGVIIK